MAEYINSILIIIESPRRYLPAGSTLARDFAAIIGACGNLITSALFAPDRRVFVAARRVVFVTQDSFRVLAFIPPSSSYLPVNFKINSTPKYL